MLCHPAFIANVRFLFLSFTIFTPCFTSHTAYA